MKADIVIKNGAVFTADVANPTAEAVAISGQKILFVGTNVQAEAYVSNKTHVIDAGGKTVMPGIIDSHFHVLWGAKSLANAQLYECENLADLEETLTAWANENQQSAWVMGSGMSYAVPTAEVDLDRHHLDKICADRPMLLFSFDMHTVWLNTLGLETVGLLNGHPPLPGDAEVVMGADGLATGALIEPAAYNLAVFKLPEPTQEEMFGILGHGMDVIASHGITTVHDMACNAEDMAQYAALEAAGRLKCRIYANQLIEPEHEVGDIERLAVPLREQYDDDRLRVGFIKFFMDGVYESFSAVTLNGYPGRPDHHGEAIFSPDQFAALAAEADRHGFQIAVHACGDGGVRRVLDGYEWALAQNGKRDSRHRIEHIEVIDEADVARFVELDVIASMQPLHAPIEKIGDSEPEVWVQHVAEEEWDRAFAWRTIRDAGIHIAFGSDWPVVTLNPILGIHAAVNREPLKPGHNSHNQTIEETLRSYTVDGAWAEFAEDKKGQLKAGLLADVVILSKNLFNIPAEEIINTEVQLTMMDGQIVFEKN